jgi:hypothetical protein
MPVILTVRDETTSGDVCHEIPLTVPSERITVRELIRERVYQEVQDFNYRNEDVIFRGLVQPNETERVLNGKRTEYRLKEHRPIDWRPQFEKAIEAFERNGFFVLVGNRQAENLDEEFVVHPGTTVSFIKLTLLVGG